MRLRACHGKTFRFVAATGSAALAMTLAALPADAATRRAASATITSAASSAWTHPGGHMTVTATVANRSHSTTARATLRGYLSRDKRRNRGDVALPGTIAVPALRRGRHVTEHHTFSIPRSVRPATFWLLICNGAQCRTSAAVVHVTGTPTPSAQLIESARSAHRISTGTAITYQVLAEFGDPRLPVAYRGDDTAVDGDSATRAAIDHWSSLSATQRALIGGYLLPPSRPTGWGSTLRAPSARGRAAGDCPHTGPRGMRHEDAPSGPVRIWYGEKDAYSAKEVPQLARDAGTIFNAFKELMGRGLPSDATFCGFNGGDGHFDVYILDPESYGKHWRGFATTSSYKGYRGQAAPSFTVFSSTPDRWELAHELFHAFQYAFKYAGQLEAYQGFDEGAANWGANYVYPRDDLEHLDDTMLHYPETNTFPDNWFGYELWVFDLYLTEKFGNQIIPAIYRAFGSQPELEALNSEIPGGFADRLPEFTRYGWNQTPAEDGFRAWDRFDAVPWIDYQQPLQPINLHLGELTQRTLNLPASLKPLARSYHPLHVDDAHIHDLLFHNTLNGIQGASVQAFVKLADGTWHTQDWTGRKTVEFCRDEGPDQDVTDLVIMYANARYQDTGPLKPSKQPSLDLQNNCDRHYAVTSVSGSYHEDVSVSDTAHGFPCTDSGTMDFTLTPDPSAQPTGGSYTPHGIGDVYVPATLSGTRSYHQECPGNTPFRDPCTASLSAKVTYLVGIGDLFTDPDDVPVQVPNLKHQDPLDEACDDQGYGWFNGDNPNYMDPTSVPRSALEGTAPFTITASNDFDDNAGRHYTTTMTITLQPTDADGQPLQ